MDFTSFIQLLLSGLLLGGIYAMVAVGLALCFGVLGLLNLAHGAFLVLAGFVFQAIHGLWPAGSLASFILVVFCRPGMASVPLPPPIFHEAFSSGLFDPRLAHNSWFGIHTRRRNFNPVGSIHGWSCKPFCNNTMGPDLSSR